MIPRSIEAYLIRISWRGDIEYAGLMLRCFEVSKGRLKQEKELE